MVFGRLARGVSKYLKDVQAVGPDVERTLFKFATQSDLEQWRTFSDSEVGGQTHVQLAPSAAHPGCSSMSGSFSTQVGKDSPLSLRRSGFCGITSLTAQSAQLDLEDFDTLIMRVKGDGRKYIVSLREDSWVVHPSAQHDIWQSFLFVRPGAWQEVQLPLKRFVLTHKGRMVENQQHMSRSRIVSMGVALAGTSIHQPEGHFELQLEWIKAANLHNDRHDTLDHQPMDTIAAV